MNNATYKYSLKADSGYKSDQNGKITPERHGVVCAALDGGLSDNLATLKAAPELLSALKLVNDCLVKCLTGGEVSAKVAGKAIERAALIIESIEGEQQ